MANVKAMPDGKWQAYAYSPREGQKVYLGTWPTEEEARHASDQKLDTRKGRKTAWTLESKGEDACRVCGAAADHLHHLVPRAEPGGDVYACPTIAGIPLCHPCHSGWHHGALTIYRDCLKVVEESYIVTAMGRDWLDARYPPRVPRDQHAALAVQSLHDLVLENERLREALRECTRLSGADLSGGFPTWPDLPDFAVQEVKQLRDDYDEACREASNPQQTP